MQPSISRKEVSGTDNSHVNWAKVPVIEWVSRADKNIPVTKYRKL